MRNAEFILKHFDEALPKTLPVKLHLLGGGALDLVHGIPRFSEDVDAMVAVSESSCFDEPWMAEAFAKTNQQLEEHGLFFTHVFDESALVHTKNWQERLAEPPANAPRFSNFEYDGVSAEDIIISKITRFDEKDQLDVRALMQVYHLSKEAIAGLFADTIVPPMWMESWQEGLKKWDGFML